MTITIAHLYYDLLNLYGESGNIKALKKHLEEQNIKVIVKFLSIQDELNIKEYDFIYIGAGTEENQKLALKHIMQYKKQMNEAIQNGTFIMVTGNALDLFGKYIIDKEQKKHKALNCFHYFTKQEQFRIVGEILATCSFVKKPIIGFQNRSSVMKEVKEENLFQLIKGTGYSPTEKQEGITYNHFYGSYTIGPILVRNPDFLKYIIKQLVISKQKDFKWKAFHFTLENKAYQNFIDHYYQEMTVN